jgi:hypothetical protein
MRPVFQDSMQAKYEAKPVMSRRMLDDMETDRAWTAGGTAKVGYALTNVRSGKRSLRFATPIRDETWISTHRRADGSFEGSYGNGFASASLKFDSPQDWTAYNRVVVWVYVHPAPVQNHVIIIRFADADTPRGNPADHESFHYAQNLRAGEWNQVIWEIPEYPRVKIPGFEILVQLRGNGPNDAQIVYDIDSIELQSVEVEPYRGWTPAAGRVSFNHVGYNLGDDKIAVAGPTDAKTFQLVGRDGPVATFPVTIVKSVKGEFKLLDFSTFDRAGRFQIRLGDHTTRSFEIQESAWLGMLGKLLNFFYCQRCGIEVPGYHHDCHQDVTSTHEGVTKVINGGWHDAGDLFQITGRTHIILRGMLELYGQVAANTKNLQLQERLLEEVSWGLEWALKMRFGKGMRSTGYRTRWFSDNSRGNADDVTGPVAFNPSDCISFCAAAAYAANTLGPGAQDLAARSLAAAIEDYDAAIEKLAGRTGAIAYGDAANAVLASLDLFKATKRDSYLKQAVRFGSVLISCQETSFKDGAPVTGYFYVDTSRQEIVRDFHTSNAHLPAMALWRLCEAQPNHADWPAWYASVVILSEYFVVRGASVTAPFDHLPNAIWNEADISAMPLGEAVTLTTGLSSSPERTLAQQKAMARSGLKIAPGQYLKTFPVWKSDNAYQDHFIRFHGAVVIQVAGAAGLMAAAQLRQSRTADQLAKKQVNWLLGVNPFGQSMIYGEGYDYQSQWAGLSADMVGAVPVGTDTFGTTDEPYWPSANIITCKEQFTLPAGQLLWGMAYSAMPALIEGEAPQGVILTNSSGRTYRVPPGPFSLSVPPGVYNAAFGTIGKHLTLVGGARRRFNFDPLHCIDFTVASEARPDGRIVVTVRLAGVGNHRLEIRVFNLDGDTDAKPVSLQDGPTRTTSWEFKLGDDAKPWVAVVAADERFSDREEIFGAALTAPAMPPL